MQASPEHKRAARHVLIKKNFGVLATNSIAIPNYPFGSLTPYCLDYEGEIIIFVSRMAQHTRNIQNDPRVSLTIVDPAPDIQASARVTYLGEAEPVREIEIAERYFRHFPKARDYGHPFLTQTSEEPDFSFYRIRLKKLRYIGGFGEIYWIDRDDFLHANPFTPQQEKSILEHMNQDHVAALRQYCQQQDISLQENPTLIGADAEGLYIRHQEDTHFIPLPDAVDSPELLRKTLISMINRQSS